MRFSQHLRHAATQRLPHFSGFFELGRLRALHGRDDDLLACKEHGIGVFHAGDFAPGNGWQGTKEPTSCLSTRRTASITSRLVDPMSISSMDGLTRWRMGHQQYRGLQRHPAETARRLGNPEFPHRRLEDEQHHSDQLEGHDDHT